MRPPAFEDGGLGRKSGGRAASVPMEQDEAAVANRLGLTGLTA